MSHEIDEIRARLDSIAEDLADLAMARLRDSLDDPDAGWAAVERRLTRARRAVEKAAHLLGEPDSV